MSQLTNHRFAGQRLPQRVSAAVEHQLVALVQEARRAELEHPPVNLGIKQDARSTESSIDERNRFASYHVVSEFVDPHDALRVSPCLAIHNNTEDAFCRVEIVGINWQNELRIVE